MRLTDRSCSICGYGSIKYSCLRSCMLCTSTSTCDRQPIADYSQYVHVCMYARTHISVSYTHLTLPTNREV